MLPLRRTVGECHGDIRVEVGRGKKKPLGRAMGEVGGGRRDDVAAPRVLDRHCDAR